MIEREPLSMIDTAWLRMDRPTNLMMICGVLMFAEHLDLSEVREVVRTRFLCFHRFRQRVVTNGGGAAWEMDPDFDLNWHVRRIALPGTAGSAELEEMVSDLISTPLDPTKPMWQFHVIDGASGGSAMVLRIHHCYGDGFAMTHVMASLTDINPDKPAAPAVDIGRRSSKRSAWERLLGPVTEAMGDAARIAWSVVETGSDWIENPSHAVAQAKVGLDLAGQLAFIANMAPDSDTRFKGSLGIMKRVAWAEPLSLFEVKAVAEALASSVNDVLLSCVTAALRVYLLEQGDLVEGVEVRALVPVNLRPPGPVRELGNHFGMVFLSLPLGEEDPVERVLEVRRRMLELKNSQQATVALGILAGMGVAPVAVKEKILETLAANASAVMTNVRGPQEPRYFAGKRITRQVFWVPQSGGIGMGISILSYAGQIDFGVVTDVKRVPDPAVLVKRFVSEFEALLQRSLTMPWPEHVRRGISRRAGKGRVAS